jgi:predicted dehydrogenase
VLGLFDPNPTAMSKLRHTFPAASHLPNLDHLSKLGADLAIVASPPRFHAEQTIQSLRFGLSVLCENPWQQPQPKARR